MAAEERDRVVCINEIYLAIPSASAEQKRDILTICGETNCKLKQLPGLYRFVVGEATVSAMKDVPVTVRVDGADRQFSTRHRWERIRRRNTMEAETCTYMSSEFWAY